MTRVRDDSTTTTEALDAFIAQVGVQYDALEQALVPVDEKIADLQKDWDLRPVAFWNPILKIIPSIRAASVGCMDLFHGKHLPIPCILDSAVTINNYTCNLRCIEEKVEEAGILLTAYLCTKGCTSVEKQIRERQRVMHALLALSQAVHDAVDDGRLRLKRASEEHRKVFCPLESLELLSDN